MSPAALRIAGTVATAAALVATAGDLLLLEVAQAGRGEFPALPTPHDGTILAGLYLGALAIPFYAAGYWQVAAGLAPAGARQARAVFLLGAYLSALGTALHAVTGVVMHVEHLRGNTALDPVAIMSRYGVFFLPTWALGSVLSSIAWVLCARAVLTGRTLYPRWTAAANPLVLLAVLVALGAGSSFGRAFLLPAAPNLTHALFFGLSTVILGRRPRAAWATDPPAEDAGAPFADPVAVPIEDALDLHAFAPRDIPSVVAEYLVAAHDAGFAEVRLIHGRGTGFQRTRVREVLAGHPLVVEARDAQPARGGPGATVVQLVPCGRSSGK